jgi:hypothetical protein
MKACPRCGHNRAANSEAPDWQCPSCGVAYQKYESYLARSRAGLAPRSAEEGMPSAPRDASVWSLVLVNGIALLVALAGGWSLIDLMTVFWVQSVIIGISYFFRMLNLKQFSTENFRINNRSVEPTRETKRQTAFFFLLHFGFFHIGYLVFILAENPGGSPLGLGLLICTVAFAINHYFSYRYHREVDASGTPNIGTLMFTPYLRVVPMHLTIVFGAVALGATGIVVFGLMKMVADVAMHLAEHRMLSGRSKASSIS